MSSFGIAEVGAGAEGEPKGFSTVYLLSCLFFLRPFFSSYNDEKFMKRSGYIFSWLGLKYTEFCNSLNELG